MCQIPRCSSCLYHLLYYHTDCHGLNCHLSSQLLHLCATHLLSFSYLLILPEQQSTRAPEHQSMGWTFRVVPSLSADLCIFKVSESRTSTFRNTESQHGSGLKMCHRIKRRQYLWTFWYHFRKCTYILTYVQNFRIFQREAWKLCLEHWDKNSGSRYCNIYSWTMQTRVVYFYQIVQMPIILLLLNSHILCFWLTLAGNCKSFFFIW